MGWDWSGEVRIFLKWSTVGSGKYNEKGVKLGRGIYSGRRKGKM